MNKLYSKDPIGIDKFKCIEAGRVLSAYRSPVEEHIWSNWNIREKLLFKIVFISICHDINWDYLQNALAEIFNNDKDKLTPDYLSQVSSATVSEWLSSYEKPERVRAAERSKLIRILGDSITEHFDGNINGLLEKCDGTLVGPNGFYALLDNLPPYKADPLRKKSHVLVHDLVRENIIEFSDIANIEPAIEYHIMRLYERTGRIFAKRTELHKALVQGVPLQGWIVKRVREVTSLALVDTAHFASQNIPDVNYVEWQIARNVCRLNDPNCMSIDNCLDGLPDDVHVLFEGRCPYMTFCHVFNEDPMSIKIKEPVPAKKNTFY